MERAQLVIGNESENGNGNGAQAAPDGGGALTPGDDLGRLPALVESLLFAAGRPVPIAQLIEALDGPGRAEVIVIFLALLELIRLRVVRARQAERFGAIALELAVGTVEEATERVGDLGQIAQWRGGEGQHGETSARDR